MSEALALSRETSPDTKDWVDRISACWRKSVEAIIEVGRLLEEAKENLPHGAFGQMIENELPFTPRVAQALMKIARDKRLTNPDYLASLPPSWGTLYELTKLPDREFVRRVSGGLIKPGMMRREVRSPIATTDSDILDQTIISGRTAGSLALGELGTLADRLEREARICRALAGRFSGDSNNQSVRESVSVLDFAAILAEVDQK